MKKYALRGLGISLSAAVIFGTSAAFAAPADDYSAAINEKITSSEFKINMEFGTTEIGDDLKKSFGVYSDKLSISYLMDGTFNSSDDMKKMQMENNINTNISGDGHTENTKLTNWIDLDLTDNDNPKYLSITKNNGSEKYLVTDLASYTTVLPIINTFQSDQLQDLANSLNLSVELKKPEYKDGVYTVTYSDDEIKKAVKDLMLDGEDLFIPILSSSMDIYQNNSDVNPTDELNVIGSADDNIDIKISDISDEQRKEYEANINKYFSLLDNIQIFDKNALTLKTQLDENKHIKSIDYAININTNLYDIITAIGPELGMTDFDIADFESEVTRSGANIKACMHMKCDYNNINGDVKVNIPEITPENSIVINADTPFIIGLTEPIDKDGTKLIPLRSFCNAFGITDENISYENGIITVRFNVSDTEKFVVTINSADVSLTHTDGSVTSFKLDNPAEIINDRTYVTLNFAEIFGLKWVEGSTYTLITE